MQKLEKPYIKKKWLGGIEIWTNVLLSLFFLCLVIGITAIIIAEIGKQIEELPPPNSTGEWKEILSDDNPCKWYQFGCQRLECVIDCNEINQEAGEIICVC